MSSYNWSLNGLPGRVGPISAQDGSSAQLRIAKDGSVVCRDGGGKYAEAVYRGNVYFACNQAGIASIAGLSSASKIFTLYNPAGSGKNVILLETICSYTTLAAVSTTIGTNVFWAGNLTPTQAAPGTATAETVQNALLGGSTGVAKVYNTCTLAAVPVAVRPLFSTDVMTAVGALNMVCKDDVAGAIILQPGVYISIQASAATLAVQAAATWVEEPL